jgi:hypothetical protein
MRPASWKGGLCEVTQASFARVFGEQGYAIRVGDVVGGFSSAQQLTKFSFILVNVEHWDLPMLTTYGKFELFEKILSGDLYRSLGGPPVPL